MAEAGAPTNDGCDRHPLSDVAQEGTLAPTAVAQDDEGVLGPCECDEKSRRSSSSIRATLSPSARRNIQFG